ncbi:MAG TPA: cobalamin-binding protein [Dehalococcoidia bacterium]|jgi:5-methyltetrahydrofolate--homocysteine methyltransferase|nr:cobalamin-binding protein [Dehalococcoidia bacterium]
MFDLEKLKDSLISGDIEQTEALTEAALEAGVAAKEILDKGLIPGLDEVGRRFQEGEYFFPELLVSGEAMKKALARLKPALTKAGGATMGKYAIGTVRGDIHDIGKNIVIMMLEGNGWEVTDLGIDVPTETFLKAVREGDYHILGMSALLTTTIPHLAETIEALKAEGLRDKIKVMVGGVSVTPAYAEQIGADAYGKDAVDAVIEAKRLIGKS